MIYIPRNVMDCGFWRTQGWIGLTLVGWCLRYHVMLTPFFYSQILDERCVLHHNASLLSRKLIINFRYLVLWVGVPAKLWGSHPHPHCYYQKEAHQVSHALPALWGSRLSQATQKWVSSFDLRLTSSFVPYSLRIMRLSCCKNQVIWVGSKG
jgi:hypothetical protein